MSGWIEGGAILFAVVLVAVVTATNNYNKEAQFRQLNAVKDDVNIATIRFGDVKDVSVKELVVGDIVVMNAGDKIPADGKAIAVNYKAQAKYMHISYFILINLRMQFRCDD